MSLFRKRYYCQKKRVRKFILNDKQISQVLSCNQVTLIDGRRRAFVIQSTSVIPASVIKDFGYNRRFYHSPTVSLCFIIVTTSVTTACHISDFGYIGFPRHSPTVGFSWIYHFFCQIIYSSQRLLCVRKQRAHSSPRHEDCMCTLIAFCTRRRRGDL
jgi:hypothetical protein